MALLNDSREIFLMKITFHAAAALKEGDRILMNLYGVMTAHKVLDNTEIEGRWAELAIEADEGPHLIRLLPAAAIVPTVEE